MSANTIDPFDVTWSTVPVLLLHSFSGFPVATVNNTTKTTLNNYSFDTNLLLGLGSEIEITGCVKFSNNVNVKTVTVEFGSQVLQTVVSVVANGVLAFKTVVRNMDDDNFTSYSEYINVSSLGSSLVTTFNNPTGSAIIAVTGQNTVAESGAIALYNFDIKLLRTSGF